MYEAFLGREPYTELEGCIRGKGVQLGSVSRYQGGQTTSRVSHSCLVRNPAFIMSAAGWGEGGIMLVSGNKVMH